MVEAALTERTNVNVHLVTEEDSAKNVIFLYPLSPFYELVCMMRLDNPPSAVQLFQRQSNLCESSCVIANSPFYDYFVEFD